MWRIISVLLFSLLLTSLLTSVLNLAIGRIDGSSRALSERANSFATFSGNNSAPTHSTPILNSTSGYNYTIDSLTCYNQSTYDADTDSVKNIYNWFKDDSSIMVLNMPFEPSGTQNATDYSGYGNNGTTSGDPTYNSTGGYDSKGAYEFDGSNDYVDLGNPSSLRLTGAMTIAAWIHLDEEPVLETHIVSKLTNSPNRGYQFMVGINGSLACYIAPTSSTLYSTGGSIYIPGEWHHVVLVYEPSTHLQLWVDGNIDANRTDSVPASQYSTPNNFNIGRRPDLGAGTPFNGTIDEVSIYNYALSAEQVNALYQSKTYLIVSNETSAGEVWSCSVTPNDGVENGATLTSNTLIVTAIPDTTPPVIVVLSPENTSYLVDSVDLNFTLNEAVVWIGYSLDGSANVTVVGNITLSDLSEGGHRVIVYAQDAAGNIGSADEWFTIDTVAPLVTILSPLNTTYRAVSLDLNFTTDEATSWIGYSLDGQSNATLTGNTTLAGLVEGFHSIVVYATDVAGNTGSSSRGFTIDTTTPAITILIPQNTTYAVDGVDLNFTVDETCPWIGYSLDGALNVTITGNTTLAALAEGYHSVIVYATDVAGNTGSASRGFSVDTLPPVITILSPQNITYAVDGVDLNFTVDETCPWIGYSLDGALNVTITGNTTLAALADGSHTIVVYASDAVGHFGSSNRWFTVRVPILTITATGNGTIIPALGAHKYAGGSNVSVTAFPDIYYLFDHWELNGSDVGSANPYWVLMNADYLLHTVFVRINYTLTIKIGEGGTTNPEHGNYTHLAGSSVQVTALPDDCYVFSHWELNGSPIFTNPVDVFMDGNYTLLSFFTLDNHDVAITNITLSKTVVGQDHWVTINVTIQNQGDFTETLNITLFGNATNIGTQTIANLGNGSSIVSTFIWNTTGFAKGNYSISAEADQVPCETDISDNTMYNGVVLITIPGDVDGDKDVDIFDIVAMADAYGTCVGDPGYNPNYDIDGDGCITIFDIVIAADNYGESW